MKKKKIFVLMVIIIISFLLDDFVHSFVLFIKNPILDNIMGWFSHELSVVFVLVVMSSIFMYNEHKKKDIPLILTSFIISGIISMLLKLIIKRPRPEIVRFIKLGIGKLLINIPDYSMPSTHSATAFSVLPVIDSDFKKIQIFWILFSLMVAISRIYLNQHYLSDVVLGSVLGYFIGYEILKLEKKHVFTKIFIKN